MGSGASRKVASSQLSPNRVSFRVTKETEEELSNLLQKQRKRRLQREKQTKELSFRQKKEEETRKEKLNKLVEQLETRKSSIEHRKLDQRAKRVAQEQELLNENEHSKKEYTGAEDTENEDQRISALRELQHDVTTPFDDSFNKITAVAQKYFGTPIVYISLVDKYSQWLKASIGLEAKYTCRNVAFCAFTIRRKKPLIVLDASTDPAFENNPIVTGPPGIRFYAGALLQTPSGFNLGTFCVADTEPREEFDEDQAKTLQQFADIVYKEMDLHRMATTQRKAKAQQEKITEFSEKALGFHELEHVIDLSIVTISENVDFECLVYLGLQEANEYKSHDVCFGENSTFKPLSMLGWKDVNEDTLQQLLEPIATHCLKNHYKYTDNILVIEDDSETKRNLLPKAETIGIELVCGIATTIFKSDGIPHGVLLAFYDRPRNLWKEEHPFMLSMSRTLSSVIERTLWATELEKERSRSEDLLLNVLPRPISLRLKAKEAPIADGYQLVTVLFADLVGFTTFASTVPPKTLVAFLNEVFSAFDRLVSQVYMLEKVKTIGDAYMCAGGLLSHEDDHPQTVVDLAMDMFRVFNEIVSDRYPDMNMRIGINTGPVTAGVIGTHKFLYDLWGDAVNVASRMESSGIPGRIQVSELTFSLLESEKNEPEAVRMIDVKGKGLMQTYILNPKKKFGE